MADLNEAIKYVLSNEDSRLSGVVTRDGGGLTRFGIAQKYHPDVPATFYTCPGVTALSMAEKIYASEYAAPLELSAIVSQPIANKLLDISVNCGVGVAAKMAQEAVNALGHAVVIDGKLGQVSVAVINAVDAGSLMAELVSLSMAFYTRLSEEGKATPNEYESWMTRAAKRGV